MKSNLVNIAVRIVILFAFLVSFVLGHASSIIVGIRHYNAMGILLFYGITYLVAFVIAIWYVIVQTPKIGWKSTLRNGLIVSFLLGFMIITILGIPISQ